MAQTVPVKMMAHGSLDTTFRAKRRSGRRGRLFRVVAISLAAWPLVAWAGAGALIVRAELPRADALVVLSGSGTYLERARGAAKLFSDGRAPRIILTNDNERSGWSSEKQRNPLFLEREADELVRHGVPSERIEVVAQPVSSTYEEAAALRHYVAAHGLRSILVVTSAYHSRRALWALRHVFRTTGVEVGLDAVAAGEQTPSATTWWWSGRGWRMVAGEYLKLAYYWAYYR